MQDLLGYDEIIEESMRGVIHDVLKKVEKSGLPGKHYFVITFLINFPGVVLPEHIKSKYDEEITIVFQHQYGSFVVEDDLFRISLSFAGKYEKIVVPYHSIVSFIDPSINFGLKFSLNALKEDENGQIFGANSSNSIKDENNEQETFDSSSKIVSLDAFRKKVSNNNEKNS